MILELILLQKKHENKKAINPYIENSNDSAVFIPCSFCRNRLEKTISVVDVIPDNAPHMIVIIIFLL